MRHAILGACVGLVMITGIAGAHSVADYNVYYTYNPPYSFFESTTGRGILMDYLEDVLHLSGQSNYHLHGDVWTEAVNKAAKDPQGVFFAGRLSDERLEVFTPTDAVYEVEHGFYKKAGTSFEYAGDPRDLVGLKVGVIAGWTYAPIFERAAYLNKIRYEDTTLGMVSLYTGQIDVLLTDTLIGEYTLTHVLGSIKWEIEEAGHLDKASIYAWVNKNISKDIFSIERFNKSLRDAKAQGLPQAYYAKYLPEQ